jgi:hypothetical protein
VLVRADSARATHTFLDWLTGKNSPRRRMRYSIGWRVDGDEHAAITALPDAAWSPALNTDGDVRDGAMVAELTGLPHLDTWPAGMRVIARRERCGCRESHPPSSRPPQPQRHDLATANDPGAHRIAARHLGK